MQGPPEIVEPFNYFNYSTTIPKYMTKNNIHRIYTVTNVHTLKNNAIMC